MEDEAGGGFRPPRVSLHIGKGTSEGNQGGCRIVLILTRKPGESVNIGERIKITIKAIKGRQVRIGIEAPPEVPIHREEAYLRSQQENREAERFGMMDVARMKRALARRAAEEKPPEALPKARAEIAWRRAASPPKVKE